MPTLPQHNGEDAELLSDARAAIKYIAKETSGKISIERLVSLLAYLVRQEPSGLCVKYFFDCLKKKHDLGTVKRIAAAIDRDSGNSALHIACYRGFPANVSILLDLSTRSFITGI